MLQQGIELYRAKLVKEDLTHTSRYTRSSSLTQMIGSTLKSGEEKFREEQRLQGGMIKSRHKGARFQRLYQEVQRVDVTEQTLRDSLPLTAHEEFDSYDKNLSLPQRALRLWTSNACYKEINRDIIQDRQALRQWMPLIKLIIQQMQAEPIANKLQTVRGSKLDSTDSYSEDAEVALSMFTASSLNTQVASGFSSGGVKVNFIIPAGCRWATVVQVSKFQKEQEVLIAPYTLVKCASKSATEVTLEVQNASWLSGTGLA